MILAIDQGTTGTRACVMDAAGVVRGRAYLEHAQHHPAPGHVEHDAEEIWACTQRVVAAALASGAGYAGVASVTRVDGIGIANQGETVLLWDRRTGRPLGRALVWQDVRAQAIVDELARDADVAAEVTARTGLRLDPYFVAPKLRWLLDHTPGARALAADGALCAGTIDTWLIWKLTAGASFVTDPSTAARTLLYDVRRLAWDPWLLARFDIPPGVLPAVRPTTGLFGEATAGPALGPIVASLVDQPAAMLGEGCLAPGQTKATFGTGCFVYLNAGPTLPRSTHGLLATIAWQRDGVTTHALDGGVFAAGAVVRWLRSELGLAASDAELDALAASVPDTGGVVCVPALVGLAAPYWRRDVRGAWLGLSLAATRAHLVRAAYEGIACRVAQVTRAMEQDAAVRLEVLRVDGGVTRSAPLMQLVADLVGVPVAVSANDEATVCGAAWLAARAAGVWRSDDELTRRVATAQRYTPRVSADERAARLATFGQAVDRLTGPMP